VVTAILLVFAWLEGLLLAGSLLTVAWGTFRHWEIQILMPIAAAMYGTAFLVAAFLATVVVHDHIHIGVR
jgi:hypothetical protein